MAMIRLAFDADVHGDIIRGLRRRIPEVDYKRVQDALPEGASDPEVLQWVLSEGRILITNDRGSMIRFAWHRVQGGLPTPGIVATTISQSVGSAIEDLSLIAKCMTEAEIRDRFVIFLPLR